MYISLFSMLVTFCGDSVPPPVIRPSVPFVTVSGMSTPAFWPAAAGP